MMGSLIEQARKIARKALASLDVEGACRGVLIREGDCLVAGDSRFELTRGKVVLIGIGKASIRMGRAVEDLLGDRMSAGLLVTDRRHKIGVRSEVIVGGHPIPDEGSLLAGNRILELAGAADEGSLIIILISGGGSALVESPVCPGISLADLQRMNRVLVGAGATIREMNVVRKHLSAIKGGRLGALIKGRCMALYVSDVNAGDLRSIASNPLLPDDASLEEFYGVIERYGLLEVLPQAICDMVKSRSICELPGGDGEEVSPDGKGWSKCGKVMGSLIMDNLTAVDAAGEAARALGFKVTVCGDLVEGYYRDIADEMIERLCALRDAGELGPLCLISGGEVSCPVKGTGTGGRNQEFVLYCGAKIASRLPGQRVCILSCGTDGIDGNSSAAGAVLDPDVLAQAKRAGLDPDDFINRNDSYSFFKAGGGLIVTGPTGNNVRDIRILLSN